MQRAKAALLKAGDLHSSGVVYTHEALRKVAESNPNVMEYKSGVLYGWIDLDNRSTLANMQRQADTYVTRFLEK